MAVHPVLSDATSSTALPLHPTFVLNRRKNSGAHVIFGRRVFPALRSQSAQADFAMCCRGFSEASLGTAAGIKHGLHLEMHPLFTCLDIV